MLVIVSVMLSEKSNHIWCRITLEKKLLSVYIINTYSILCKCLKLLITQMCPKNIHHSHAEIYSTGKCIVVAIWCGLISNSKNNTSKIDDLTILFNVEFKILFHAIKYPTRNTSVRLTS